MQRQERLDTSALAALQRELEDVLETRATAVPGALRDALKLALQETFADIAQGSDAPRDVLHAFVHELAFEIMLYADEVEAETLAEDLSASIEASLARAAAAA